MPCAFLQLLEFLSPKCLRLLEPVVVCARPSGYVQGLESDTCRRNMGWAKQREQYLQAQKSIAETQSRDQKSYSKRATRCSKDAQKRNSVYSKAQYQGHNS